MGEAKRRRAQRGGTLAPLFRPRVLIVDGAFYGLERDARVIRLRLTRGARVHDPIICEKVRQAGRDAEQKERAPAEDTEAVGAPSLHPDSENP